MYYTNYYTRIHTCSYKYYFLPKDSTWQSCISMKMLGVPKQQVQLVSRYLKWTSQNIRRACTAKPVKAEPTFRESQALFEIPPSQTMYKQYVKLK